MAGQLWHRLGSHVVGDHVRFSVWAPNAAAVALVGDWNDWAEEPMVRDTAGSGVWSLESGSAREGDRYKYAISAASLAGQSAEPVLHADPLARRAEIPPSSASIIDDSRYDWATPSDASTAKRERRCGSRLSVYEVHLGSWKRRRGESLTYLELAEELPQWVSKLGFTHAEFLPTATYPFGGSWGYQQTGYYAPDARLGSPNHLKALIEAFHEAELGVIMDWVPAHFPGDDFGLADFDGGATYEHPDPLRGIHPDWDTRVFDFARPEVREFLISNALYWLREFRADGLRVDAVASMLYRDYSRRDGDWLPHPLGGREDLDAVSLLRQLNDTVQRECPNSLMIAEDSTLWPDVTTSVADGGLGFTHKWNLGWMHDTLQYFETPIPDRSRAHAKLVKPSTYDSAEHWMLPLGHDEVVHLKGSLLGKQVGADQAQRFANLRALLAWQWCHPGSQLLFMGGELAQLTEWSHDHELPWNLLHEAAHSGVAHLVAELNAVQERYQSLSSDHDPTAMMTWLEPNDDESSVFSFMRISDGAPTVVVVANLGESVRFGYRVGVPSSGNWTLALNTDHQSFGGEGGDVLADGSLTATADAATPWQSQPLSLVLVLPPLSVSIWVRENPGEVVTSEGAVTAA